MLQVKVKHSVVVHCWKGMCVSSTEKDKWYNCRAHGHVSFFLGGHRSPVHLRVKQIFIWAPEMADVRKLIDEFGLWIPIWMDLVPQDRVDHQFWSPSHKLDRTIFYILLSSKLTVRCG